MKMTNRIGKVHKTYVLIGGGMGVLSGIAVAVTVGSPLPVLRLWGADVLLPPLWILGILWLAGYALLGGAAGYAWGCPGGGLGTPIAMHIRCSCCSTRQGRATL